MAISKQQSMRPAEIELIDASNQHESTLQAHAQSLETLDKSLTAETTDRKSADTALGTRIDNEVQARTSSDTNLQGQLSDMRDSVSRTEFTNIEWARFQYNNPEYPFDIWTCDKNGTIHLLRVNPSGLEYGTIVNDVYRTVWTK